MERLEKLLGILRDTPHHQPRVVKEATQRILNRATRNDAQIGVLLGQMIERLIQYCDNDDSSERSVFNDHLNSVILAFQNQHLNLILQVLVDVLAQNGSARTLIAALNRIPHLICNTKPVELGCEPQKLLKALIEIARRYDDESVQKALASTLKHVIMYLDYQIRKDKNIQFLTNSLIEVLLRNLYSDSSSTKRLAASSISNICSSSEHQLKNTIGKLDNHLQSLSEATTIEQVDSNKFVGFCLCVRELPYFATQRCEPVIKVILKFIKLKTDDMVAVLQGLETLRDLLRFPIEANLANECAKLIVDTFLLSKSDGNPSVRTDTKVILQSNSLACVSLLIKQYPRMLNSMETLLQLKNHQDTAVQGQVISIIGNYIRSSWKFPDCVERSVDCEKTRKLWVELRSILHDDYVHPDTLKSCVIAIKTVIDTLLESDHCLHIIEYQDFNQLINLYHSSNSRPFKVETLDLLSRLNFRTLHYLECCHWSKIRAHTAGSLFNTLQERILNEVIIASLNDEHLMIRSAAAEAIVEIVPNLYITSSNSGPRISLHRCGDPIVSLADDLSSEHLVVLSQAEGHMSLMNEADDALINLELYDKLCITDRNISLSSSIIQLQDDQGANRSRNQQNVNLSINLMYVVASLKLTLESSMIEGKVTMTSIVHALHSLALAYPIHQYSAAWDCRPSEYCECFTLLSFLLTYLENLVEPDVIIEDLEAYRCFLELCSKLLYALCHESVLCEYEHQKIQPCHKRSNHSITGSWCSLTIKHKCIAELLQVYFSHLMKLLGLITCVLDERPNPFSKAPQSNQHKSVPPESMISHEGLISERMLFTRLHKKLEASYESSKKNLNQSEEKFFQMVETCLSSLSTLLEFIGMSKSLEIVKELLGYLKTTSAISGALSVMCTRQLLKSLFGINILALYQIDPYDWFEDEPRRQSTSVIQMQEGSSTVLQGVYHYLISNPDKVFSNYHSMNNAQITPVSDKTLATLNFESRRALRVRRRIEDRVSSLFDMNPDQVKSPKVKSISEILRNTITEFSPIVTDCMGQFNRTGFCSFQTETLNLMSYLIILRVNYKKLASANDLLTSVNKLLDGCGEQMFLARNLEMEPFLTTSFTFLILLTYERGPTRPFFQVATVIEKFDDLRAKLSISSSGSADTTNSIVPLLRCLVEDLFIYRTGHFQNTFDSKIDIKDSQQANTGGAIETDKMENSTKDVFEVLEAERETIAQKLLDVIDNPGVYDLLSILILESRRNASEIKYKKLSQNLSTIIPSRLSKRTIDLADYGRVELTRKIIENISPEVFQPISFIFGTLLEMPELRENKSHEENSSDFQRWMSSVLISIHILITQVKEEVFLSRINELMSHVAFVEYLLHIIQICIAQVFVHLIQSPLTGVYDSSIVFIIQQLSSYLLYLAHMFQSGLFFQLTRNAENLIKKVIRENVQGPESFRDLCLWSRQPSNGFCLNACETMFYHIRLAFPDLTIYWCNVMMLLNNVDCNRDFWRNLLIYECHNCFVSQISDDDAVSADAGEQSTKKQEGLKRASNVGRPSSLNLSDISIQDQLRRSFIKKIATAETRDKVAMNRNIVESNDMDGHMFEQEVYSGNTQQCLATNVELARRGTLCLVLDFVSANMNDVEHVTWLIIHHINDIIRWSYETPIAEFITAVHGNSASSGIFIQAINTSFRDVTSISLVTRLLWTLERVHYTQYGSLVVLLVEKLLGSEDLAPYRSVTKKIEDFACDTVQKLLNETNKSLVTTKDEVMNQLTAEDLDRFITMLDADLYPELTKLLKELRQSAPEESEIPLIQFNRALMNSDDDSSNEPDEVEQLCSSVRLIHRLSSQKLTAHISSIIPALNMIKNALGDRNLIERLRKEESVTCCIISAIHSLVLTILPPPTRMIKPRFWTGQLQEKSNTTFDFSQALTNNSANKPMTLFGPKRVPSAECTSVMISPKNNQDIKEEVRTCCLKALFLVENIDLLKVTQFGCLVELITRIARLPLVNSFIILPPALWRQNIWPVQFDENDSYMTQLPMVPHDVLMRDHSVLENFCDRVLKLGWVNRRQFEEIWMTLLGVLSASLSSLPSAKTPDQNNDNDSKSFAQSLDAKVNLVTACTVVTTVAKFLVLTLRKKIGDPLAPELHQLHTFDERVAETTRSISSNLTLLRKKAQKYLDVIDAEQSRAANDPPTPSRKSHRAVGTQSLGYINYHLRIPAHKLRLKSILNLDMDNQGSSDTGTTDNSGPRVNANAAEGVDVESCIRLLLSIFKQKFKDPSEDLLLAQDPIENGPVDGAGKDEGDSIRSEDSFNQSNAKSSRRDKNSKLPSPLTTAISQAALTISDLFTDYDQFYWLFETYVTLFRAAERSEDEIQMQQLVIGICKAATICSYEIPNELTTLNSINSREVMFDKCLACVERCLRCEFGPLKTNALQALYYMLEDSINIVASGAWELDDFKRLRQSRLAWVLRLSPVILDKDNFQYVSRAPNTLKLLESLCETVSETELKSIKL